MNLPRILCSEGGVWVPMIRAHALFVRKVFVRNLSLLRNHGVDNWGLFFVLIEGSPGMACACFVTSMIFLL